MLEGDNFHKVKICSGGPFGGMQSIVAQKAWWQRQEVDDHMTSSQEEVNIQSVGEGWLETLKAWL